MGDTLKESLQLLKQSAGSLNAVADKAATIVRSIETFLSGECSVGVTRYVRVSEETTAGNTVKTYLGYARYNGKFRIVVCYAGGTGGEIEKPWSELDRDSKLDTIPFLPQLLKEIATEIAAKVNAATKAISQVESMLDLPNPKEGK
jgi:hypothetical protein